jgi:hypothetical protein
MTHRDFQEAYRRGEIRVQVDRRLAAKYLSSRLLLPVFVTPVIGLGAAFALWGWIWQGLVLVAIGFVLPQLIRISAPHFILTQALEDESVYHETVSAQIIAITRVSE